jgi:hypothetical protein
MVWTSLAPAGSQSLAQYITMQAFTVIHHNADPVLGFLLCNVAVGSVPIVLGDMLSLSSVQGA